MVDLKALEPFPVLQYAVAVVVACAGVYAIYRGARDGKKAPAAPDPTLLFFDGPVGECIKALERIGIALEHAPILQAELRHGLNDIGERVSDAKRVLFAEIEKVEVKEVAAREKLEERVRKCETDVARLTASGRRR